MATSLIGLPIILTTALAASLVPAVSEAHATVNKGRIIERASTAMKIANLFAIPACIGLCVLATPIFSVNICNAQCRSRYCRD